MQCICRKTTNSLQEITRALLTYSSEYEHCAILSSSGFADPEYGKYDILAAFGAKAIIRLETEIGSFDAFRQFCETNPGWKFGYLTYDLKNDTEKLISENQDSVGMPALCFLVPEVVIELKNDEISISGSTEQVERASKSLTKHLSPNDLERIQPKGSLTAIQTRITSAEYIDALNAIQKHIRFGDIYEMNFCQEFYINDIVINSESLFYSLNQLSPAPFSAFLKFPGHRVMCSSPERYLQKTGTRLISQPIKGTIRRGETEAKDNALRISLMGSEKNRSENVMIVDLVRNDLSRTAEKGSVKVEELSGAYSFPYVHHLISTISAELRSDMHWVDAIKHSFPMGSMTGAPKISAMKIIEKYESAKRGLFSGSIGYITPESDFDFNVVIRSFLYNTETKYLSFMAGGAITAGSDPNDEYEESCLKVKGLIKSLSDI